MSPLSRFDLNVAEIETLTWFDAEVARKPHRAPGDRGLTAKPVGRSRHQAVKRDTTFGVGVSAAGFVGGTSRFYGNWRLPGSRIDRIKVPTVKVCAGGYYEVSPGIDLGNRIPFFIDEP